MAPRNIQLLLTLLYTFYIEVTGKMAFYPSIQWTPDNPIIQNLNGKVRKVRSNDGLNLWCPKDYTQLIHTNGQLQPKNLYFTLYKVDTKEEYDKCDATKGKQLLKCDDPEMLGGGKNYKQIVFLETTFLQDVYIPGNYYYFIGTSGGRRETLDDKIGGKCASDNFKFAIYVCGKDEPDCNVEVRNGGWSLWRRNKKTGICHRNCTNPVPENGGNPCMGPSSISCSQVISEEPTSNVVIDKELETITTEPSVDISHTVAETPSPTRRPQPTKIPIFIENTLVSKKTSEKPSDRERSIERTSDAENEHLSLTMKEAILTFIGLFIVGCMVGILQVLAIIHFRSKRVPSKPTADQPVNV